MRTAGAVLIPVDLLREWLREQARAGGDRADAVVGEFLEAIGTESAVRSAARGH